MNNAAWAERITSEIIREFGQPRAVADHDQVQHLARMLALLEGWSPGSYPLLPDPDFTEPRRDDADDGK